MIKLEGNMMIIIIEHTMSFGNDTILITIVFLNLVSPQSFLCSRLSCCAKLRSIVKTTCS